MIRITARRTEPTKQPDLTTSSMSSMSSSEQSQHPHPERKAFQSKQWVKLPIERGSVLTVRDSYGLLQQDEYYKHYGSFMSSIGGVVGTMERIDFTDRESQNMFMLHDWFSRFYEKISLIIRHVESDTTGFIRKHPPSFDSQSWCYALGQPDRVRRYMKYKLIGDSIVECLFENNATIPGQSKYANVFTQIAEKNFSKVMGCARCTFCVQLPGFLLAVNMPMFIARKKVCPEVLSKAFFMMPIENVLDVSESLEMTRDRTILDKCVNIVSDMDIFMKMFVLNIKKEFIEKSSKILDSRELFYNSSEHILNVLLGVAEFCNYRFERIRGGYLYGVDKNPDSNIFVRQTMKHIIGNTETMKHIRTGVIQLMMRCLMAGLAAKKGGDLVSDAIVLDEEPYTRNLICGKDALWCGYVPPVIEHTSHDVWFVIVQPWKTCIAKLNFNDKMVIQTREFIFNTEYQTSLKDLGDSDAIQKVALQAIRHFDKCDETTNKPVDFIGMYNAYKKKSREDVAEKHEYEQDIQQDIQRHPIASSSGCAPEFEQPVKPVINPQPTQHAIDLYDKYNSVYSELVFLYHENNIDIEKFKKDALVLILKSNNEIRKGEGCTGSEESIAKLQKLNAGITKLIRNSKIGRTDKTKTIQNDVNEFVEEFILLLV